MGEDLQEKDLLHEELQRHFKENRERLLKDFAFLGELLQKGMASGEGSVVDAEEQSSIPNVNVNSGAGGWTDSEDIFIGELLSEKLKCHEIGATTDSARLLHATILACPCIRVPHPGWARAYAEAVGNNAVFNILPARPTWSSFSDVWDDGLNLVWRQALGMGDLLYILHIQNIDLSLVESWVMPLVNILLSHSQFLSVPGFPVWPDNLRITWSTADGCLERFPLSEKFLLCFPAVFGPSALPNTLSLSPVECGFSGIRYASFDYWAYLTDTECGELAVPEEVLQRYPDVAPTINRDVYAIRSQIERLFVDYDCSKAFEVARSIRLAGLNRDDKSHD